jgi:hypothetical protein
MTHHAVACKPSIISVDNRTILADDNFAAHSGSAIGAPDALDSLFRHHEQYRNNHSMLILINILIIPACWNDDDVDEYI